MLIFLGHRREAAEHLCQATGWTRALNPAPPPVNQPLQISAVMITRAAHKASEAGTATEFAAVAHVLRFLACQTRVDMKELEGLEPATSKAIVDTLAIALGVPTDGDR